MEQTVERGLEELDVSGVSEKAVSDMFSPGVGKTIVCRAREVFRQKRADPSFLSKLGEFCAEAAQEKFENICLSYQNNTKILPKKSGGIGSAIWRDALGTTMVELLWEFSLKQAINEFLRDSGVLTSVVLAARKKTEPVEEQNPAPETKKVFGECVYETQSSTHPELEKFLPKLSEMSRVYEALSKSPIHVSPGFGEIVSGLVEASVYPDLRQQLEEVVLEASFRSKSPIAREDAKKIFEKIPPSASAAYTLLIQGEEFSPQKAKAFLSEINDELESFGREKLLEVAGKIKDTGELVVDNLKNKYGEGLLDRVRELVFAYLCVLAKENKPSEKTLKTGLEKIGFTS